MARQTTIGIAEANPALWAAWLRWAEAQRRPADATAHEDAKRAFWAEMRRIPGHRRPRIAAFRAEAAAVWVVVDRRVADAAFGVLGAWRSREGARVAAEEAGGSPGSVCWADDNGEVADATAEIAVFSVVVR